MLVTGQDRTGQEPTGYPSIDKPWLKFYSEKAHNLNIPECTVYEYLALNSRGHENEPALIFINKKISFGQLMSNVDLVVSAFIAVGIKQGDIVTINLPSIPEVVYCFYALSKIGAIANIIDPRSDAATLEYYLNEAKSNILIFLSLCEPVVKKVLKRTSVQIAVGVTATESLPIINFFSKTKIKGNEFITWQQFLERGRKTSAIESVEAHAPVLMTHTSGTTGMPKGVVLSNYNINAVVHQYSVGMDHDRGQRYLCIIPPFVAFGICVAIHLPLGLGMQCVLIPRFNADKFSKYLHKYHPEHFTCAPMSLGPLINSNFHEDLSYIKTPAVGGDYINPIFEKKVNDFLKSHNCRQPLIKGYGMTEVSSSACTTSACCNAPGSVGVPLAAMTISIFKIGTLEELPFGEEGEICFCGPNIMLRYFEKPVDTEKVLKLHGDGKIWMHSGDVGYMNEDGLVFVIDRLKRTAWKNGHLVLPSKVERLVLDLPEIDQCAAITEDGGDISLFCVVKQLGNMEEMELAIREKCHKELPEYMVIKNIIFRDSLPLTSVGKVDFITLEKAVPRILKKQD